MSHEIESMAFTGSRNAIWHRLGKQVSNDLSPEQMMHVSGADFLVYKEPLFFELNGEKKPTNYSMLLRDSDKRSLSFVTNDWEPVQNFEAFDFFHQFVESGQMYMDTAGVLKGGEIVWVLAKVNDSFEIFGGDKIDSYLLFSNPHKFGFAVNIRFTAVRVVCNNTLNLALQEFSSRSVRLTHRSKFDPEKVKDTLNISKKKMLKYKEDAEFLGSKRYKLDDLIEYCNSLYPSTGKKERTKNSQLIETAIETQPGSKFAEGTWWSAYNSVTYLTDNVFSKTDETRLYNAWYGSTSTLKQKAFKKALEYANNS